MKHLVRVALAALLAPLLLVTTPAFAADNGSWSVFPTATPEVGNRPYFQMTLDPGAVVEDSVTIANATDAEATFNLYAADAINTADGGFSLTRRTDPQGDVGSWVELPVEVVTLPARTQMVVPFTMTVPGDVAPGDHAGGIVIESTTGSTAQDGDVVVTTLAAVGTRIYVRVQGALEPELRITALSVSADTNIGSALGGPVGAEVTYTVVNTGNVRLTPEAATTFEPLFGGGTTLDTLVLPELLPNGSATITQRVDSILPLGRITAKVTVTADGAVASGENSAVVLPWLLFIGLGLLIVGGWYARRRRSGSSDELPADAADSEVEEPVAN